MELDPRTNLQDLRVARLVGKYIGQYIAVPSSDETGYLNEAIIVPRYKALRLGISIHGELPDTDDDSLLYQIDRLLEEGIDTRFN